MIKILVKTFNLGDVEDPEIYLGGAWWDFEQTEQGQWVKKHALDLVYNQSMDYATYGYKYVVTGLFNDEDALFYKLKWGDAKQLR
jgi:hypothetical protein